MNKINLKFNVRATIISLPVYFIYAMAGGFGKYDHDEFLIISDLRDKIPKIAFDMLEVSLIFVLIAAWMYTFKYLYNNIASEIFSVRNITLAEAYALSLLGSVFFIIFG